MCRLICAFVVHIWQKRVFSWCGSYIKEYWFHMWHAILRTQIKFLITVWTPKYMYLQDRHPSFSPLFRWLLWTLTQEMFWYSLCISEVIEGCLLTWIAHIVLCYDFLISYMYTLILTREHRLANVFKFLFAVGTLPTCLADSLQMMSLTNPDLVHAYW